MQITDGNYEAEVAQTRMPVLIVFGAPWASPFRFFEPTIKYIANEYAGRVKVGEVNVDENAELVKKFDIKGIPTLVIIKNGSERERVVGLIPKKSVSQLLDKQLDSNP
jgi:thioredoxin 1